MDNMYCIYIFGILLYCDRFSFVSHLSQSKVLSGPLRRLLLVKLSSLITLIGVILWQIQCTQPLPEEKGTQCSVDFTLKTFQDRVEEGSEGTCPTVRYSLLNHIHMHLLYIHTYCTYIMVYYIWN